jgi:hypothetical protein
VREGVAWMSFRFIALIFHPQSSQGSEVR